MTILTISERKALEAVESGIVVRAYSRTGSVIKVKGISSRTLWRMERAGFIKDKRLPRYCGSSFLQTLTETGRNALAAARK